MQVSVEELDGLERRMTVQVPAEKIDPEVQNRLKSLSPKVKLNGFRPGKVPFKTIKRMYGAQVRQEVLGEVLQSSYQDALTQENLHPIGTPKIEPKNVKEGEDLEYSAIFEVLPEFEVTGIEGIKVERPVSEVTETDIDTMIETLRQRHTIWNDVERPCQQGDRIMIDFEGKIDGEDFPNNKRENTPLILGSNTMPKDFEEHLFGLQVGAETEFDTTFPDPYPAQDLVGKTVHFAIKVNAVAESLLPEIDDDFIAKFDIKEGGIESLRKAIRENMEHQLNDRIKTNVKQQLMQGLLAANDIPIPQSMVKAQLEQLAQQAGFPATDDEKTAELKARLLEQQAPESRRRAALGLIIARLAEANDIKIDNTRVDTRLSSIAANYEEAAAVIQWYKENPEAMSDIRALVLEEQVVDWLLDHVTVTEKHYSFDEFMKPETATTTSPGVTSDDQQ